MHFHWSKFTIRFNDQNTEFSTELYSSTIDMRICSEIIHSGLKMETANLFVTQANHGPKIKLTKLLWKHEDFHQVFVHFVGYLTKFCHLYWL
jgi:hypothetical protein